MFPPPSFAVGIYCCLELDEYGKFERKARTCPVTMDNATLISTWDQVIRYIYWYQDAVLLHVLYYRHSTVQLLMLALFARVLFMLVSDILA